MKNKLKENQGITLIALVITIIVLLILAGVSIAMLTGQNGILSQAENAKTRTTQSSAEEMVSVAIGGLQAENLGDTSKITPQMIADQVNEENNRSDVTAEGTSFPTNIVFNDDGIKVSVDVNLKVGDASDEETDLPIYSVDIDESKIAPKELFRIEKITEASNTKLASTEGITLSDDTVGTARILGIWPEYCNENGYDPISDTSGKYSDTNYKINYPGITDSLIIPYQVEIDGELYKITEVNLNVYSAFTLTGIPRIENIIFPNTVTKIEMKGSTDSGNARGVNNVTKNIVLSENTTEICDYMFAGCNKISTVNIPQNVTKIGQCAFYGCEGLSNINIKGEIESIGDRAFSYCTNLSEITIKESVRTVGNYLFENWSSSQTIHVPFAEGEEPPGWPASWKHSTGANIDYKEPVS